MKPIIQLEQPHITTADCLVKQNKTINSDYNHLILQAPAQMLAIIPGQFFQLRCPSSDKYSPYLRRPMSIYHVDSSLGELHFLYKIQGVGTRSLATLQVGDLLNIMGPLGNGFTIPKETKRMVLVARGVGLATMNPLVDLAKKQNCQLTAICSARTPEQLLSIAHFRDKGVNVISITDNDKSSSIENLREILIQTIHLGADAFYTCGSNRILILLQQLAAQYNIWGQVALEQHMACGLGMCHGCVRQFNIAGVSTTLRVCKEGPVFNLQEAVAW